MVCVRAIVLAALFVSVAVAGCVDRHTFERCRGDDATWDSDGTGTLCHDGRLRTFLFVLPDHDGPAALLIALHGGAGDADNMARKTRLPAMAADEGFALLVPDGTPAFRGGDLRTWNAAHCCGKARDAGTDDVGFIDALVEAAQAHLLVDAARIGVTGHSNGGMMAHAYAAQSDVATHIMPVAGAIGGRTPVDGPLEQIPAPEHAPAKVLIIHADDDPRVPYDGGQGQNLGTQRFDLSVADAVAFWEGVGANVTVVTTHGGHGWPGGESDIAAGPTSPDASRLIVDFLHS